MIPPTYRHGRGHKPDDVAIATTGEPVKVWGPDKTEDLYQQKIKEVQIQRQNSRRQAAHLQFS